MSLKNYLEEADKFRILRKEDFEAIAKSGPSEELKKRQREAKVVTYEEEEDEEKD